MDWRKIRAFNLHTSSPILTKPREAFPMFFTFQRFFPGNLMYGGTAQQIAKT